MTESTTPRAVECAALDEHEPHIWQTAGGTDYSCDGSGEPYVRDPKGEQSLQPNGAGSFRQWTGSDWVWSTERVGPTPPEIAAIEAAAYERWRNQGLISDEQREIVSGSSTPELWKTPWGNTLGGVILAFGIAAALIMAVLVFAHMVGAPL